MPVSRTHNCFLWKRWGRGIAFCSWPINAVINGANFTWTLRIITSCSPSPSSCLYGSTDNVFASLMRVQQRHRGQWRVKSGTTSHLGLQSGTPRRYLQRPLKARQRLTQSWPSPRCPLLTCVDLKCYPVYLCHNNVSLVGVMEMIFQVHLPANIIEKINQISVFNSVSGDKLILFYLNYIFF